MSSFEDLSPIEKKMLITLQAWAPVNTARKTESWMGVIFLSGQQKLVASLKELAGILPVGHLARVPGVKSWCKGVGVYRSIIFSVTDMADFLTQTMTPIERSTRILLIKQRDEYFGLLVNSVVGLEHLSPHEIVKKEKITEGVDKAYAPFITQACVTARWELPIFQCLALVQDPSFLDVI